MISEKIGINKVLVHHSLKKLLKHNEVDYIELDRNLATAFLGKHVQRRSCFFFIPGKINPEEFEEQVRVRFQSAE